ncbi:MAG: orotate phosphoribosyltransferase [Candidatus Gastranaerophilales bacterium]|nr:orotate phosphoribosyltransferase [Candidatus Gastranaerophilales bacterium]
MTDEVLNILEKSQGILHGHFCLTSGLHSDIYFQCAKLYQYPDITEQLGKKLAEKLRDVEFDTIISPAIGAVIIGYETAKQAKKRNLFVERKDGVMQLRRGYSLKKGEKVVIIEDVITTAKTIKETIEAIKEYEPQVAAVGCIVDRTKGKTDYNIKSLLQIEPVVYEPSNCPLCKEHIELVKPGSREEKAKA